MHNLILRLFVAIMEARKWLQEKKSGLDSNSDIGYASPSLNLVTLLRLPKDNGSPVDVAKSYMRALPPWASPSIDLTKPPTPSGIQLFKEETPHLYDSTSSSKLLRVLELVWESKYIYNSTNLVDASANLAKGLGSRVSPGTQDDNKEITTSGLRDESLDDMNRDGDQVKVNGINDTNGSGNKLDSIEETKEDCKMGSGWSRTQTLDNETTSVIVFIGTRTRNERFKDGRRRREDPKETKHCPQRNSNR
ncbi:hypothetical protein RJT34_16368 [Clitoria ternatea]|uniref:Uncharacterized protein n=1 Tax=Clitoria ternatea TaxID=43366 RepID=A0AAN9J8C7_CLITE